MPRKLVQRQFVVGRFPASQPAATFVEARRRVWDDDVVRARLELPGKLLSDYFRDRGRSRLGRQVEAANRWAETCDVVVLVAPHDAAESARALVVGVAHPFYNQLSHGGRGGRPALFVIEPTLDNDRLQGVRDLCEASSGRWGLAVVESPETNDVAYWFREHTTEDYFPLEDAALFAVSLVGADVVALLKGSVWFHERGRQSLATDDDAVRLLDFIAAAPTQLVVWHDALFPLTQRLAAGVCASLAVSRGAEYAARRRLLDEPSSRRLHLFSEVVRRDRLGAVAGEEPAPFITSDDALAGHCVPAPTALIAAYDEVRSAEIAAGTPSAEIRLTRLNDMAIGELYAWFEAVKLIADHVESGSLS